MFVNNEIGVRQPVEEIGKKTNNPISQIFFSYSHTFQIRENKFPRKLFYKSPIIFFHDKSGLQIIINSLIFDWL